MTEALDSHPVSPGFALRVGVTGTRHLPPAHTGRIEREIQFVLALIRDRAHALAADPDVAAVFMPDPDGVVRPHLRVLSPIAEGADRLVAHAALETGFRLDAPMPFERSEYAKDFDIPESRAEFDALFVRAGDCAPDGRPRVLELDGGPGYDRSASYGAVGRLIVRNCDVLIAVWHGHPGIGPGGTADTVRFAARSGPPVWWIHSGESLPNQENAQPIAPENAPKPAWVETLAELRRPHTLNRGADAETRLLDYLAAIIRPPPPISPLREGVFGRLFGHAHPPLPRFYAETLPMERPATGWLW